MPRILITGGAGAIGHSLTTHACENADHVVVLDDLSSGHKDLLPDAKNLTFIKGDITNEENVRKAMQGVDVVYHLAAHFANQNSVEHPVRDAEVNAIGTLNLLEEARRAGVKRFIYASSSCVYGDMKTQGDENAAPIQLDTPYAVSKYAGEEYALFYHRHHDLPVVVLRIFNSYGPGEKPGSYRNVIPNFMAKAMREEPLTITGTGKETRDFNYVENLVDAFLLATDNEDAIGEVFNIGGGEETTIQELAETINDVTGNPAGLEYVARRDWDEVLRRRADIAKAKRILGYAPENDLRKGIKKTYDWFKRMGLP